MAYYLQSSALSTGYVLMDQMSQGIGGGATRISWDIEFEAIRNGIDFIPLGWQTDSTKIVFLKSDNSFELRVGGQTFNATAAAMGVAGTSDFHKYKLQHREVGTSYQTTLFVDDVQIVTWNLSGPDRWAIFDYLFTLGSATRHGGIKYFSYTDNITAANSRYYDANASGGTGTTVPETTGNGTAATQQGIWEAGDAEWIGYTPASTGPGINPAEGEALVEVTAPATDTTSIFYQLASGTIATGDYVHHTDSLNTVVNADGTFTQTVDGNFDARVWDATDETWGAWVTIEVNLAVEVVDDWPFSKGIRPAGPVTWKYGNRHPITQMRVRMKK